MTGDRLAYQSGKKGVCFPYAPILVLFAKYLKGDRMSKSTYLLTVCTLAIGLATPIAFAQKTVIVGDYRVAFSENCQSNNAGFSAPPNLIALGPIHTVFNSWESRMTFRRNGHVREVQTGSFSVPEALQQPVGTYEAVCEYEATPNRDGSSTLLGECNSTVVSGLAMGEHDNIKPVIKRVFSPSTDVLLLSETGADIQTQTTTIFGNFFRICQGHGVGFAF